MNGAEQGPDAKGRPHEQEDLWRRLRTFRAGTWFCKPTAAGPPECARRGWTNTGPDLLACEVSFFTACCRCVLSHRGTYSPE